MGMGGLASREPCFRSAGHVMRSRPRVLAHARRATTLEVLIIIASFISSSDEHTCTSRNVSSLSLSPTSPRHSTPADMNDPGLHEPAQEAAQDVEKNEPQDEQAEQEEQEFLDPTYDFC
jgi:hypothetical protein